MNTKEKLFKITFNIMLTDIGANGIISIKPDLEKIGKLTNKKDLRSIFVNNYNDVIFDLLKSIDNTYDDLDAKFTITYIVMGEIDLNLSIMIADVLKDKGKLYMWDSVLKEEVLIN